MTTNKIDLLTVAQFDDRPSMGRAAADAATGRIKELLGEQEAVNIIFAAAPSQNEFLDALTGQNGIEWGRINAFHMDEYIGLPENAPQRFGQFLSERLFAKVPFRSINYLNGNAANIEEECKRYTDLLAQYPTDIVCMGIGENCHIAFNDPHVANFEDDVWVKVVDLDVACRQQQVNDGCFAELDQVPTHALTLTIPALMAAPAVFCVVPGKNKVSAVRYTVNAEISTLFPSTILRTHPNAVLFLDDESVLGMQ